MSTRRPRCAHCSHRMARPRIDHKPHVGRNDVSLILVAMFAGEPSPPSPAPLLSRHLLLALHMLAVSSCPLVALKEPRRSRHQRCRSDSPSRGVIAVSALGKLRRPRHQVCSALLGSRRPRSQVRARLRDGFAWRRLAARRRLCSLNAPQEPRCPRNAGSKGWTQAMLVDYAGGGHQVREGLEGDSQVVIACWRVGGALPPSALVHQG